jgi:hypothetical protein
MKPRDSGVPRRFLHPDGVPEGSPAALQAAGAEGWSRTPGFTRGWVPAAFQAAGDRLRLCATHLLRVRNLLTVASGFLGTRFGW